MSQKNPEQLLEDFRASFLLKLTREIISNTESYKSSSITEKEKLQVKKEVEEFIEQEYEGLTPSIEGKTEEVKEEIRRVEIKDIIQTRTNKDSEKMTEMKKIGLEPELRMMAKSVPKTRLREIPIIPPTTSIVRIQEPELPATVRDVKPKATNEGIDLGKMNLLIGDPLVKIMECNGPEENVVVMGIMGRKPTPVKLTHQEIEEVVGKFAAAAKIPVYEGLFKAAVGNLVMSAVISEIAGIKFIIRKI